jgi:thioredoxin reductase (NADPH)
VTASFDVIVVGEGLAGLTAANEAARCGARTASFEAVLFGGLVTNVTVLDPAPDAQAPSGADLAAGLVGENADLGVHSLPEQVGALARDGDGWRVVTDAGEYRARRVVVASGARLRVLGVPGEAELTGRGVSSCADCDGPLHRGRDVVVVGGGDSALQEALVLAEFCARVHVVNRGEAFTGRADLVERLAAHSNVTVLHGTTVARIEGGDGVERVVLAGAGAERIVPCAGVFAYVGLEPNAGWLPEEVRRDADGRVVADAALLTSAPGVYAAGAVRAGCGGTLADAIRDGRTAGRNAAAAAARPA